MRVLSDFTGRWALSRRIVPVTGAEARFEGVAEWTPEGTYEERGVLSVQGQPPLQAERRYRWDADLSVYFEDGRFFHKVPPLGGETGHWCDPDQYDVVYDFGTWPRWQVSWQVLGPRKNYEMISDYSPA